MAKTIDDKAEVLEKDIKDLLKDWQREPVKKLQVAIKKKTHEYQSLTGRPYNCTLQREVYNGLL